MKNEALDRFGSFLVKRVRDQTIWEWDKVVDGQMKDADTRRVRERLTSFDAQQMEVVHYLIPKIVDTTLHYLLFALEGEKSIEIAVHLEDRVVPDLKKVSDGLAGDMLDWIPLFSAERYEPLV
jgi:hypothetical protein